MKDKIIELFNGKFQVNQDLLLQYVDFCLSHKVDKKKFGKYECELHHILPKNSKCFPELYQELKANAKRQRKEISKGMVTCIKDGKFQSIPKEERDKFKYLTWNGIYVFVFDKKTGERKAIKKEDYNRDDYYIHTNGNASYYNILTKEREWTPVSEKKNIHLTLNKRIFIRNSLGIIFLGCVRNLNEDNMIFGIPSEDLECQILKC